MYLHLGAPRLFVTILYINSGYDRLSYLYMPLYRFTMQLDATRKNSGYETIAAVTCVYNCRYDLLHQGEVRPDTYLMLRLLLHIQEVSGSNLCSWAGYHH